MQADRREETEAPYPNPHTLAERRKLSNLGHWLEGGVLGVTAALALLDALKPELRWPGRWWPRAAAASGLGLGGWLLAASGHHGGPRLYFRHEHQDRQHLQMAALLAAGGALEASDTGKLGDFGWAAGLAGVGALFLSHEQHGSGEARAEAERVHRSLGTSLIATGAAKAADAARLPGPWRFVWPLLALDVAGRLLRYREPDGAFE